MGNYTLIQTSLDDQTKLDIHVHNKIEDDPTWKKGEEDNGLPERFISLHQEMLYW